ncbi:THAP domain-containing 9 [Paramuricea clavata]|uniref:THAP domain-containing 9, partial n=1 Tax=Paramuricea clavata TaxID=317549 RepID=A0A6S7IL05_PARCT|nr:THAP domain-containing 9 [Paramuricea clavata]
MVIVQLATSSQIPSEYIETSELNPYIANTQDPYITAYLKPDILPLTLVVGDGKEYNSEKVKYINQPLKQNSNYVVFLRFYASQESYYSTEWSNSVKTMPNLPVEYLRDSKTTELSSGNKKTRMDLIIPLVLLVLCFLLSLGVIIYQRRRFQSYNKNSGHESHTLRQTEQAENFVLEKWEEAVRDANNRPEWKATKYSHVCSNHFHHREYIIPPSDNGTCRLKNNAVPTTFHKPIRSNYGISRTARRRMKTPCDCQPLTSVDKVNLDHAYCKKSEPAEDQNTGRPVLEDKLKRKIKSLQQQLRRTKAKQQTMADIIHELQQKFILTSDDAENMHSKLDKIQLSIFRDTKNNVSCAPNGRRYTEIVKEFVTTLNYYSPKTYQYVRSILPLPHPSIIRKWSSILECEPGFIKEAFESLQKDAMSFPEKQDCCLIIDAMSTSKQTLWDSQQDKYVGLVNYGTVPTEKPDILASEAVVFLFVVARSHWKCPIGYFLADKMLGKTQAQLVRIALEMAAEAGLRLWSITTNGITVNITMFRELGCNFTTSYDSMVTKFKHPTENYYVYAILDSCHMLKLARNPLAHLTCFVDEENKLIKWNFFTSLNTIQESEGFTLANKLSSKHLKFERHKINVKLAAQTLSSSVADAIEFLEASMKLKQFQDSAGTVKFDEDLSSPFDLKA